MGTVQNEKKEFAIKLSNVENEAIRDHLQTVLNLDKRIAEMRSQARREQRGLEMAWAAAFHRNAKNVDLPEACPLFIKDNQVNVTIEPDGTARWTEIRDGEQ